MDPNELPNGGTAPRRTRPRVVIVGGGFAGLTAARALKRAPVDVTVLDRTNHHLFQPLLYQVATAVLSPADIASPIRFLLRKQANTTVLLAEAHAVDVTRRVVVADQGRREIPYDYLILAPGARHSYFGHPEWEALAPGLKSLADAEAIRSRFLLAFEEAEKATDPAEQAAWMTVVIVGAGPTGVELAGMFPVSARRGLGREFRHADLTRARVLLVEGGPRVLPAFPAALAARALKDLEEDLGVEVRTNAAVTRVEPDAVYIGDERIPARTVVWAAGNVASPLLKSLGAPLDRAGRVLVEPDLSVPGHPELFVVGDAAAARLRADDEPPAARSWEGSARKDAPAAGRAAGRAADAPKPVTATPPPAYVPGVAQGANQMGAHAARMIVRTLRGEPRLGFRYRDKGNLAVIGRNRAVADLGRVKLTGFVAWVTWLFVHVLYLAGFRNRVSVLLEWGYAYFTYRRGARIVGERHVAEAHARGTNGAEVAPPGGAAAAPRAAGPAPVQRGGARRPSQAEAPAERAASARDPRG